MDKKSIDSYHRAMLVVFEHPDGTHGAMLTLNISRNHLVDFFGLPDKLRADETMVVPLRHNTDGRTDFENWNIDAPETDVPVEREKVVEAYQVEDGETPIELWFESSAFERLKEYFYLNMSQ